MIPRDSLFMKHLRRQRWPTLIAAGVLLAQAVVVVGLPLPVRFVLNHLLVPPKGVPPELPWFIPAGGPPEWLLGLAVAWLAALCGASALLEVGEELWLSRSVTAIVEGARRDLLDLLLSRRQRFVDGRAKADIVGRLSADTANLEAMLSVGLPTLVRGVPTLLMILLMLSTLNRVFGLAMLAVVLTMYLFNRHFSREVRAHEKEARSQGNRFEQDAYQTLQAFPLIKSLSMEPASAGLMAATARRITESLVRRQVAEGLLHASLGTTKNLMRIAILTVGGAAALRGELAVGDLVLFLSYVESVSTPINELSKFSVKRAKAVVGIERIEELIRDAKKHPETEGSAPVDADAPLTLRLREASFAYSEGAVALRRYSALLQPGDLIAVVGPSGSGKSTFLKLLNRLLDPIEGEILLGGRPLRDYRLADLRAHVTAVPQEIFFLAGTIRENLRIAVREPVDDAALWTALDRVGARAFVEALPGGLDARIGEGGLRLSGGQDRRLGVARAFLRPRRGVFAFDEPTSGLDPRSASVFVASIRALAADGATVLWSTHRLEEIGAASRVLFFNAGQNPALGSHEDLLRGSPAYAAFLAAEAQEPRHPSAAGGA